MTLKEDAKEHQCHWQAFPFQLIPWHNPKAKPTELNKDSKSQPPPREKAAHAHVTGRRRVSAPTESKNMGQLLFLKHFSPLMMNTT